MYEGNDYVYSGLTTGTMWDMVMKFISTNEANNYSDLKDSTWGNYNNTILNNMHGQYMAVDENTGTTSSLKNASLINGSRFGILSTASTDETRKKNIYDLAGNLWEWTQEACWYPDYEEHYIIRGGGFDNSSSNWPVCYCAHELVMDTKTHAGFRPALFIK